MKSSCLRRLLLLAFCLGAQGLSAAELPTWASPYVTPEALAWKKKAPRVILLDETSEQYVRADFIRRTERTVMQVNEPDGITAAPRPIFSYNQDQTNITALKLWHHTPEGKTRVIDRKYALDVAAMPSQHFWNAYRSILLQQPTEIKAGDLLLWEIVYEGSTHPTRTQIWYAGNDPLYHGSFALTPVAGGQFHWYSPHSLLQNPSVDQATGTYTWMMDRYAPSNVGKPTHFLATPAGVAATYSSPEIPFSTWEQVSSACAKIIEPQITLTPALTAKAQSVIAGKTTRWEKIRALVDFIQAEVSYLSMSGNTDILDGFRPQAVEQCLANRYGDCKDKASLLVALLRAIGDQGQIVLLYAGNPTLVTNERALVYFNHAITAIPADADTPADWPIATHPRLGRFVIVDSTTSHNPLGTLPWSDQSGYGLLVQPTGGDLIALPTDVPGGYHGTRDKLTLTLDSSGAGQIHLEEIHRGQNAVRLENLRRAQPKQDLLPIIEKRLSELAPRIENIKWSETPDRANNTIALTIDCLAPHFANPAGNNLLLFTLPIPHRPEMLAPWRTARPGQSWLPLTDCETEIVIKLAPGTTLAEPIPSLELREKGTLATLKGELSGDELHLRTAFLQPAGLLDKADYEALRSLRQKYLHALKQPILLKSSHAAGSGAAKAAGEQP